MFKKSLISIALLASSAPVFAHGVWAAMRADHLQIVYGEGPLDNFYNPKWFDFAKAVDKNFKEVNLTVIQNGDILNLKPAKNAEIIIIQSENGYWSNTKSGKWLNVSKQENQEATKGKAHHKMSVNYLNQVLVLKGQKPQKIAKPQALGLPMEIVPATDPRFLKAGDTLNVQVLYQGKPLKNIDLMPDAINQLGKTIKTDNNGNATVTVANNGVNMLAVETAFARQDKSLADSDAYFSSLNFTLEPQE